ncbi:Solanesyl diphosphate synthase [Globisporangium polare]
MKLLVRAALGVSARLQTQQTRALSSFREQAVRAVASKLRSDLESNPNLWLSAGAVDEPTVSILDPAHGYAIANGAHAASNAEFERLAASDVAITYLKTDTDLLVDPFRLVQDEMADINGSIKKILGSDHPVLSAVAQYFFEHDGGKKVRPTMILLIAHAAEAHRAAVGSPLPPNQSAEFTLAAQQRIAEITEMIHTASLLHDDVIDESDTRRGVPSVNKVFGAKLAILAGDFLLARSSVCLARLRSLEAVELMSTAIEHLVKGEVMQMKNADGRDGITPFEYYLRKNYYKTGSLMSNSCKAALELGKHEERVAGLGFAYGRHIGLAFQLIDDVLDYQGHQSGKPLLADLKSGLATAPLLLAQEEFPVLRELAARKFERDGDIELASELVEKSTGIERSRELAIGQAELACQAVMQFAPSPARDALVRLAQMVVYRSK